MSSSLRREEKQSFLFYSYNENQASKPQLLDSTERERERNYSNSSYLEFPLSKSLKAFNRFFFLNLKTPWVHEAFLNHILRNYILLVVISLYSWNLCPTDTKPFTVDPFHSCLFMSIDLTAPLAFQILPLWFVLNVWMFSKNITVAL